MVMVADLRATQMARILLSLVRVGFAAALGLLVVDALDLERGLQRIP